MDPPQPPRHGGSKENTPSEPDESLSVPIPDPEKAHPPRLVGVLYDNSVYEFDRRNRMRRLAYEVVYQAGWQADEVERQFHVMLEGIHRAREIALRIANRVPNLRDGQQSAHNPHLPPYLSPQAGPSGSSNQVRQERERDEGTIERGTDPQEEHHASGHRSGRGSFAPGVTRTRANSPSGNAVQSFAGPSTNQNPYRLEPVTETFVPTDRVQYSRPYPRFSNRAVEYGPHEQPRYLIEYASRNQDPEHLHRTSEERGPAVHEERDHQQQSYRTQPHAGPSRLRSPFAPPHHSPALQYGDSHLPTESGYHSTPDPADEEEAVQEGEPGPSRRADTPVYDLRADTPVYDLRAARAEDQARHRPFGRRMSDLLNPEDLQDSKDQLVNARWPGLIPPRHPSSGPMHEQTHGPAESVALENELQGSVSQYQIDDAEDGHNEDVKLEEEEIRAPSVSPPENAGANLSSSLQEMDDPDLVIHYPSPPPGLRQRHSSAEPAEPNTLGLTLGNLSHLRGESFFGQATLQEQDGDEDDIERMSQRRARSTESRRPPSNDEVPVLQRGSPSTVLDSGRLPPGTARGSVRSSTVHVPSRASPKSKDSDDESEPRVTRTAGAPSPEERQAEPPEQPPVRRSSRIRARVAERPEPLAPRTRSEQVRRQRLQQRDEEDVDRNHPEPPTGRKRGRDEEDDEESSDREEGPSSRPKAKRARATPAPKGKPRRKNHGWSRKKRTGKDKDEE